MKDFFIDLKDRFKNPFFSTLLISWVFLNWNVIAALFIESDYFIVKCGCSSRIAYVFEALNYNGFGRLYFFPFVIASLYQFVIFPYILIGYRGYIFEHAKFLRDNRIAKNIKDKGLVIPIEVMLEDRKILDKRKSEYVAAIGRETEFRNNYEKLFTENAKIQKDYSESINFYVNKLAIHNSEFLNDYWMVETDYKETNMKNIQYFKIKNDIVFSYTNKENERVYGDIILFKTDENKTSVNFVIITRDTEDDRFIKLIPSAFNVLRDFKVRYFDLKQLGNGIFIGYENNIIKSTFTRLSKSDFDKIMNKVL